MTRTVYGIPTCGTVKKARAWLDARAVPYVWVDLRAAPPSPEKIQAWSAAFGTKAMRNTSGAAYRALGAEKASWGDAEWAAAFARDPMLLKRPLIDGDGAPLSVGWQGSDAELSARLHLG